MDEVNTQKTDGTVRATCLVDSEAGTYRGGKWAMRENTEKWMELCNQAANEQDSQKLMALIREIAAILDAKRGRLIERDLQHLKSESTELLPNRLV